MPSSAPCLDPTHGEWPCQQHSHAGLLCSDEHEIAVWRNAVAETSTGACLKPRPPLTQRLCVTAPSERVTGAPSSPTALRCVWTSPSVAHAPLCADDEPPVMPWATIVRYAQRATAVGYTVGQSPRSHIPPRPHL